MKRLEYVFVLYCLLSSICVNADATLVKYSVADLGGGQFEYGYIITNNSLTSSIEEFTIWFDVHLYDNLTITTQEPSATQWSEIILKKTGFGLPMGYDALALLPNPGIGQGETINGFSVSFDWLGMGKPGPQYYEIVNPSTFVTIDYGYTVPEPATLLLLVLGTLAIRAKRKL